MAFRHGKSSAVLFNGYNLSSYLNEATVTADVETAETTAFGNSAKTYIAGLKDATASFSGMYDGATGAVDSIMSTALASSIDSVLSFAPDSGIAKGNRVGLLAALETSYEVSSPVGDVVSISLDVQGDGGVDYGYFVNDSATVTATGNQTGSLDNTSATTNGIVAQVHVTANTMTGNTTFVLQHSSDNTTFADLVTFVATATNTLEGQRVAVTGTVNRYLRTKYTCAGTGSITFVMAAARR